MKPLVLPPYNRSTLISGLAKLLEEYLPGIPLRVKVEVAKPDRTNKQNAYLWAIPYKMISEETGYDKDELHEWFCGTHFGWKQRKRPKTPHNPEGIEDVPVRTTTKDENGKHDICSMEDFQAIWAMAQRKGAFLGLVIPDPDPDYWKKKND